MMMGLLVHLGRHDGGAGGAAAGGRGGAGGRGHLAVYGTGHAQRMVAGQQHRIGKQLLAHGTPQFVLHARGAGDLVPGDYGEGGG